MRQSQLLASFQLSTCQGLADDHGFASKMMHSTLSGIQDNWSNPCDEVRNSSRICICLSVSLVKMLRLEPTAGYEAWSALRKLQVSIVPTKLLLSTNLGFIGTPSAAWKEDVPCSSTDKGSRLPGVADIVEQDTPQGHARSERFTLQHMSGWTLPRC